ncbi:MAG: hypothetical protein QNK05_00770 [Myxococcota bacterium]|nr:hypothetical protein [Myxococcota bacterium]
MRPLPRPPIPIDSLLPDPGLVRRLVEANAPYWPVQRYFSSAAEYGALSGDREARQMFVAPVFRGDWAIGGKPRIEGLEPILHHEGLIDSAGRLFDGEIVRPFAVYANLTWQLPFHQGGGHTDVPAFRGIDRSRHPIWLLTVMGHSGLFAEEQIRIATAVAWFYEGVGGGFEYWPEGPLGVCCVHEGRIHNTAILGDNDLMYHRVRPTGEPGRGIVQGMSTDSLLHHEGAGTWRVAEGERELARFEWPALRTSVSWKAYVFADASEARRVDEGRDALTLDAVFERFHADLERRGVPCERPRDPMRDTGFVRLLASTYVQEPTLPS